MVGERRARVAAAEEMDLPVEDDGGVSATRRGKPRTLGPLPSTGVEDERAIRRYVRDRVKAAEHVDASINFGGGRRVQALPRQSRHIGPVSAVEAFHLEHRPSGRTGSGERVDRVAGADDGVCGARVQQGRCALPGSALARRRRRNRARGACTEHEKRDDLSS